MRKLSTPLAHAERDFTPQPYVGQRPSRRQEIWPTRFLTSLADEADGIPTFRPAEAPETTAPAAPLEKPPVVAIAELIDLRPQRPGGKYGAVPDPTPEEIHQRCAEIQAEWDPRTERSRRAVEFEPARFPGASLREAEAER